MPHNMWWLCIYLVFLLSNVSSWSSTSGNGKTSDRCFCKLQGDLDDCSCTVEKLEHLNNVLLHPRLGSLLHTDFFNYMKLNLNRPCPFWKDDSKCSMRDCHVEECTPKEIPATIKAAEKEFDNVHEKQKYLKKAEDCEEEKAAKELGSLDTSISDIARETFKKWSKHDNEQNNFCELDDENSADMTYVDLLKNPERFTGYVGASPQRVWNAIYNENCFKPEVPPYGYSQPSSIAGKFSRYGMCLEKRVFYRLISGLHTSINVHLCANYLMPAKNGYGAKEWGPNIEEFNKRFDPELTNGEGPQRLRNLYFAYLVELRALAKAAPYLQKELYFTGSDKLDTDTRQAVKEILDLVKSFPHHFDESKLFQGDKKIAQELKEGFRQHFLNISRIMDCVGCDKCKMWGKIQTMGMGTALKILFSGDSIGPESTVDSNQKFYFQLRRSEIVSLLHAFGRLSFSIKEVEQFRKMAEKPGS